MDQTVDILFYLNTCKTVVSVLADTSVITYLLDVYMTLENNE